MEHRHGDRAIGIVLGIVLGVAVVIGFVFLGSSSTVDAPSIKGHKNAPQTGNKPTPVQKGTPLVRVISGGPPGGGPPKLEFKRGQKVRFKVTSDLTEDIEILGIPGQQHTVPTGGTALFQFNAKKTGLFAVIIPSTHITVATLHIAK